MNDQRTRIYAVNLMNRAGIAFDVRDIATVGKIVDLIEADVTVFLNRYGTIMGQSHGRAADFILPAAERIAEGGHRPSPDVNEERLVQS